ncbi:endonuclease III [Aminipila luticellarii]|uniref:Endonuclease III n=1 Tax=Aminipila luticellarii TaxID=2507160 RepID=A0A410PWD1_9FIRM|nr:endonuclease III [Aminipila luticellarii]QAT43227.1 endonuclease III [Aminipila luticellarii]
MRFTKQKINELLDKLEEMYPEADCALDHQSVFQLLISVVLSAQTTDKSVNQVTGNLFSAYPDAASLAEASEEDVQALIKRIGLYKTKSKNIIALCKALTEKYDGQVPDDYDKLVELPGVGRKTANVVLSVGFGHQRIAVDTHVFRVSNRIGLVHEKDVLKTELALMKAIPEERWSRTHHSLIFHGRYCCDAKKPKCETCGISAFCEAFHS